MTTETEPTRLLAKLGSETFLNARSLLVWLAPLMVTLSLATSRATNLQEVLAWLFANLVAIAILLAASSLIRNRVYGKSPERVLNIFWVIGISALLGGIKTLMTLTVVSWTLGSSLEVERYWFKIVLGSLIGVVALSAGSFWGLVLQKLEFERQLLLAAKSAELPIALSTKERSSLVDLKAGLSKLSRELNLNKDAKHLSSFHARLLRELVERNVRPLSTSLYNAMEQKYQSVAPRALIVQALRSSPPASVVAFFYLLAIGENIERFGLQVGIVTTLTGASLILIWLWVVFRLLSSLNAINPASFLISASVVPALLVATVNQVFGEPAPSAWVSTLSVGLWLAEVSLLATSFQIARRTAALIRVESELLGVGGNLGSLELRRRTVANQLHGEVQSRLMALVLQEQGGQQVSSQAAASELDALMEFLDSRSDMDESSFEQMMQGLVGRWRGFAAIEHLVPEPMPKEINPGPLFYLIEEAVSNSFRHGLASQVTIELSVDPEPKLTVLDNGIGPVSGPAGLGSKVLDSAAISWTLSPGAQGGSQLTVFLK